MNKQIDISVIIVSWNVKNLLKKCLESIIKHQNNLNLEIIVVDNASTDGTVDWLKTKTLNSGIRNSKFKTIFNSNNLGFAKANNLGIKISTGKYILILNPDTEIEKNTLQEMFTFFEHHSDSGVASCKHLNSDRSLQLSIRKFPTFWSQFLILHKLHHLTPKLKTFRNYYANDFDYEKISPCDQVQGSFFMISHKCLEKVGLFDENFFLWFEEVDYCKRAHNAGLKIYYNPKAKIIHYGGQSFKQVLTLKKQKIFNKSLLYYFKKHHSKLENFLMLWAHINSLILAWILSLLFQKK